MSKAAVPGPVPGQVAGEVDIDVLSHELFVASRRIFGAEIFPQPGRFYYEHEFDEVDKVLAPAEDIDAFDFIVTVDSLSHGAQIANYNVELLAYGPSSYRNYRAVLSREFIIDPVGLAVQSTVNHYFYNDSSASPRTFRPKDNIVTAHMPGEEQLEHRPRISREFSEEMKTSMTLDDLRSIYSSLGRTGVYRVMGSDAGREYDEE